MLDQHSCADGFHVLMQPSGLSDTEWHCAPILIYVLKGRWRGGWKRKRYADEKQEVREGTKTRPTLIIAGLLEEEDDGGRIRG